MGRELTVAKATVYPYLESKEADKIKREPDLGIKGFAGCNTTSSIVDEALGTYRGKILTTVEKQELQDWNFILNKSKDVIEQHFDKRVSQVFTQAVLCYNTDYTFREGHTFQQGRGANHLGEVKFNAAHHATVPCIYALSNSTNKEVVFHYRSGFYDESNATADVIKQVNEADRAIDEKTNTSLLRQKTIALLNKAAKAELSPPEIIKQFLSAAIEEIDKAISKEQKEVVDVLNLYRQQAEGLKDYVDKPENIDRWLNLCLDQDPILLTPNITNRELVKRKINDLPIVIHNERHQKANESHIPCHFYDLYYHKVLSRFNADEQKIIENAIGIEFAALDEKVKTFKYGKRTNALLRRHAKKIEQLRKEILPLIAEQQNRPAKKEHLNLSSAKKCCLRPSLYRLRYQIIAADQAAQSAIKTLLDTTLNKVKNGTRASHFDDFFYHAVLNEAQTPATRLLFGKLLNVSPSTLDQKIREVKVNQIAHAAISPFASDLCRLSDKIRKNELSRQDLKDKIAKVIGQIADSSSSNRTDITKLCYHRLYDHVDSPTEKARLEKLIVSKKSIEDWITANTKETAAEKKVERKRDEIKTAVEAVLKEIGDLNKKLDQYKNELLKELRKANGMKQEDFLNEYKRDSRMTMNIHELIDLEKGRSVITSKIAERTAHVFGLSPTIFSPSHFAD
jgi:hypothetical protein